MRTVSLVRVLACFPSDVREEAELLDSICDELNRILGPTHALNLQVVRWDRDVRAGSARDGQTFVNEQLNDDFDILVGVFWQRIGTPTPRAMSGSAEEIERALERANRSGGLPLVMIYFKGALVDPTRLDLQQLGALKEFKRNLEHRGVVTKSFIDGTAFESLLRIDLAHAANDVVTLTKTSKAPPQTTSTPPHDEDDDDVPGFLDLLDTYEEAMQRSHELMAEQTKAIDYLSEAGVFDAEQIRKATASRDRRAMREILERSAAVWNDYSAKSDERVAKLDKVTDDAFGALSSGLALGDPASTEARSSLRDSLIRLAETLNRSAASAKSFRDTISRFPRVTSELNRAKSRLMKSLDKWTFSFENRAKLVRTIAESLGSGRESDGN